MNLKTHTQCGSTRITVLAGAIALIVIGIGFATRPHTAAAPQEPQESRASQQAPATTQPSHELQISPSADDNSKVYDYY